MKLMFYDVFVNLCQSNNITPSRAAQELGINKSNVSNWKNNGYTPRGQALNDIAAYFGVTTDYLLTGEQKSSQQEVGNSDDIDAMVNDILSSLSGNKANTLMLDGKPTSAKALQYLRDSIRANIEYAKKLNEEEGKK